MTTRHNLTLKSCIMVALLILVGIFAGCNNDKSDNSKPFEFLGEAIGRPENFDKDTVVTPENIDSLYRQYTVEELLGGDYYLVRSKKSDTTSRYLSRLIRMKNGRQVAAKTFYDSDIDANAVIRLKNRIIVGLNSLRDNNYDSTFHMSTHKCRVIVLSDSLTPIQGKRFFSQRGHTYIESLMQNTDSTFFCSVASGDVELGPKARYQSRVRYNMYVESQMYITNYYDYEIWSEELDLTMPDWGNDLSDEVLNMLRQQIIADSTRIDLSKIFNNDTRIPRDFVLVPGGVYHASEWDDKTEKERNFDVKIDSFYVCKYELTQKEFENVMGRIDPQNYTFTIDADKAKTFKGDSIPVIGSYLDFINYCNKKNSQDGYDGFYNVDGKKVSVKSTGNGYRLLTKYEWAYLAQKGNYYKKNNLGDVAWYGRNSNNRPHAVGQKLPNDLGVYDMFGNVSEFLLDDKSFRGFRCYGGGDYMSWLYYTDVLWTEQRIGTRIAFVPKD